MVPTKEQLDALDTLLDYAAYGLNGICPETNGWAADNHEGTKNDLRFAIRHGIGLANALRYREIHQ
jgi:hypothetical protein